jgi:hypothetical protein
MYTRTGMIQKIEHLGFSIHSYFKMSYGKPRARLAFSSKRYNDSRIESLGIHGV